MTQMDPYVRGKRDGLRLAITWLHARAREMNDPNAKTILNTAAFNMGVEMVNETATPQVTNGERE